MKSKKHITKKLIKFPSKFKAIKEFKLLKKKLQNHLKKLENSSDSKGTFKTSNRKKKN